MVKEVKLNTNKIRGVLAEKKINHEVIAKQFGVTRVTISNMLNNRAKINAEQLYILSKLVGVSMEYFFE